MNTVNRSKLYEKYGDERVLVIPSSLIGDFSEGFIRMGPNILEDFQHEAFFLLRAEAEFNPNYKQFIPYALIRFNSDYFVMSRLGGSGEARLINKMSLGVGGHINPIDTPTSWSGDIFTNALFREIEEETTLRAPLRVQFEGFINDNSNQVGLDHLGLVYTVESPTEDIAVRETKKLKGGFVNWWDIADVATQNYLSNMESWSKIAFDCCIFPKHYGKGDNSE